MGKTTKIQWADHTFNPWWGCTKVSPACDNCYAWELDRRLKPEGEMHWGPGAPRRFFGDAYWEQPHKWNKAAAEAGVKRRVFCGSMCDVMEWPELPKYADLWNRQQRMRERLWATIEDTDNLIWMLLTKRPENYKKLLPLSWQRESRENVWVMTTVESQAHIDRLDHLLEVPAVQYGISAEPLLGELDLRRYLQAVRQPDLSGMTERQVEYARIYFREPEVINWWVIAGGESGAKARPSNPDHFRSLRDQCVEAGVPFFFKQWGEWAPMSQQDKEIDEDSVVLWSPSASTREMPHATGKYVGRVGKNFAGSVLDGREWHQVPGVLNLDEQRWPDNYMEGA